MGEEAFYAFEFDGVDGHDERLVVRGGYCRDEVYIGICKPGECGPAMLVAVDGAGLKRALRSMNIGKPKVVANWKGPHRLDVETGDGYRGICECGWIGPWREDERAAEFSGAMHLSQARRHGWKAPAR